MKVILSGIIIICALTHRYMLETGAANPKASTLNTPMEELGDMMKYVITHEIGNALGLAA